MAEVVVMMMMMMAVQVASVRKVTTASHDNCAVILISFIHQKVDIITK